MISTATIHINIKTTTARKIIVKIAMKLMSFQPNDGAKASPIDALPDRTGPGYGSGVVILRPRFTYSFIGWLNRF